MQGKPETNPIQHCSLPVWQDPLRYALNLHDNKPPNTLLQSSKEAQRGAGHVAAWCSCTIPVVVTSLGRSK